MGIEKIQLTHKSRDGVLALLRDLQHLWFDTSLLEHLFDLLEKEIVLEVNHTLDRPRMHFFLWGG